MSHPAPIALVTGASSGIGRATSRALRDAGWTVYASARRPEALADLAADGLRSVALDVTDDASMREAVASVLREAGRIDLLVNNAGYGLIGPIETLGMDDLRRQFATNVFGLIRMTQLVLPAMRERGSGRIVNIGSIGGVLTLPGEGAYHATKYAVEAISDALRIEAGQFGVGVSLIQPTGVRTRFFDTMAATDRGDAETGPYARLMDGYRRTFANLTEGAGGPFLIEPEEVARLVVKAATAARPRSRYKAGWSAYLLAGARRLSPDWVWDAAMRRALGIAGQAPAAERPAGADAGPSPAAGPQGSP